LRGGVPESGALDDGFLEHGEPRGEVQAAAAADDDHPAVNGEGVEVLLQVDVGLHLDDHRNAVSVGDLRQFVEVAGFAVVDDVLGACGADEICSRAGARRADDHGSGIVGKLRGVDADAAACAVDGNRLTGLQPGLLEQRAPCGQARDADRRALAEGQGGRQRVDRAASMTANSA